ncbi:phosphoglycerate mutase [Desulfonema ishimotonii]|uniref:Phosphoglycerate mutase n=1 Tax=Desulfonema ishimotonii TaxID=45657 RepID=A0A401G148_9BACT|nr:alkaline phosphatase family protein [Desulfonema ishimotonii]GBC62949.1 phosphoglycerate mutase [Desulfonema ishimotonii]
MAKKCILILLDGIGDRSYKQFDRQTPLQAARTPNLDRLAGSGATGLFHATELGRALPSENAHFAMFGCDMAEFPGRGTLEALGAGIQLSPSDVAMLAHFVNAKPVSGSLCLVRDKIAASDDEAEALFSAVARYDAGDVSVRLTRTHGLYGILLFKGNVSRFVTDTGALADGSPLIEPQPWIECEDDPAAHRTADALKSYLMWVWKTLTNHPVNERRKTAHQLPLNMIATQRAGQVRQTPMPFKERWGLRGLSIASGIVYHGLAQYIGMDAEKVTDTGDAGRDLAHRLDIARERLADYDFIHVHTKTPDEAAHSKDPLAKLAVIESLDRGIGDAIGPLLADPEVFIIITADHSTPSSGPLVHSGEPVPMLFLGEGVRRDAAERFDEVAVGGGALGCVRGRELMYLVLNHLDRIRLEGIMDTPAGQPYWPGSVKPFTLPE